MKATNKSNSELLVQAIIGCAAAIALTAGATLGVAAELQRGFSSAYEGLEQQHDSAVSRTKVERARLPAADTSGAANQT